MNRLRALLTSITSAARRVVDRPSAPAPSPAGPTATGPTAHPGVEVTLEDVGAPTAEVGILNGAFAPTTFDANLTLLLDNLPLVGIRGLSTRETDIAVAYALRNKMAHGLERPAAATVEFERNMPRLFFALFAVLEELYPQYKPIRRSALFGWKSSETSIQHAHETIGLHFQSSWRLSRCGRSRTGGPRRRRAPG